MSLTCLSLTQPLKPRARLSTKVSSCLLLSRENPNPNSSNTQSTRRKEEQQLARFYVPFDGLALAVTWATQIYRKKAHDPSMGDISKAIP